MYYAEVNNNNVIVVFGKCPDESILNDNQMEISEDIFNMRGSCQVTIEQDIYGNITNVISVPKPEEIPTREKINEKVVAKIRNNYSIDDEFQMQRLGMQDNTNAEYQEYLQYINECITWGSNLKQQYGYV
jgi:deoxyxylulose-5-phosphate synthase